MDGAPDLHALRVLSDPTRARILTSVMQSPSGRVLVGRLAEELGLTQPTVSHHVKALTDLGMLQRDPDGRRVWYSIPVTEVDRLDELLAAPPTSAGIAEVRDRVVADLALRFAGTFGRETVARYVDESFALLAARAGRDPLLPSHAAQFAAERLTALGRERTPDGARKAPPEVLFVCVQNAGRSQIASAILRQLAGEKVRVRTAGSDPAGAVRSVVVSALDEIGVSLDGEFPKPLTDEVVRAADVVVTMGCGDACPVYPGRRYLDWDLEDPAGLPLGRVRRIRDEIEARVRGLIADLDIV